MTIVTDINFLRRRSISMSKVDIDGCKGIVCKLKDSVQDGLGLSAIQIGYPLRLFIMKLANEEEGEWIVVCNPQIVEQYGRTISQAEGCLSLPNRRVNTERCKYVHAKWINEKGEEKEGVFTRLEAIIFQHEYDHLDGTLMIDRQVQSKPKVGRNQPCPCGSGKKYKKCCLLKENENDI